MRRKKRNLTIDRKIELTRHHEDGEVVNTLSKAFSKSVRYRRNKKAALETRNTHKVG